MVEQKKLKPRDPDFVKRVEQIFERAAFVKDVGYRLEKVGIGTAETSLILLPRHLQQNNFAHAGVLATMADHTAGCAGGSLIAPEQVILSIEYKINMLRPAIGESLLCNAEVLRNGKTIIVVDSYVHSIHKGRQKLVAKATVTLAVVSGAYD